RNAQPAIDEPRGRNMGMSDETGWTGARIRTSLGRAPMFAIVLAVVLGVAPAGGAMAFELSSTAFAPNQTIPAKHTCDGADLSPPLAWKEAPPATKSFALVCDDPDAPVGTWVHWVV